METDYLSPLFTIVIPTKNSKSLINLLEALSRVSDYPFLGEILVVGQQEMSSFKQKNRFRYVHVDRDQTPARNRNIGAQEATSEWIYFIDTDCVPHPNWHRIIYSEITKGPKAIGGGVQAPTEMPYWGKCFHFFAFEDQAVELSSKPKNVKFAASLNFAIHRTTFIKLQGFNESLTTAAEDVDLCKRLIKEGHQISYLPNALVTHYHDRLDFFSAASKAYQWGDIFSHWRLGTISKAPRFIIICLGMPFIGELGMLLRVAIRTIIRPLQKRAYLRYLHLLPGVAIMDVVHSFGMLEGIRRYASENRRRNP